MNPKPYNYRGSQDFGNEEAINQALNRGFQKSARCQGQRERFEACDGPAGVVLRRGARTSLSRCSNSILRGVYIDLHFFGTKMTPWISAVLAVFLALAISSGNFLS